MSALLRAGRSLCRLGGRQPARVGPVSSPVPKRFMATYPPHEVVGLPALSPTMTHGNLAEWKLKEGDSFSPGDVICAVETDKAVVDFEAQDDGVVAKILVPGGTSDVAVGTPIFVSVETAEDVPPFKDFKPEAEPALSHKEETPGAVSTPSRPAPQPEVIPLDKSGKPIAPGDFLVSVVAPPATPAKAPVPPPSPKKETKETSPVAPKTPASKSSPAPKKPSSPSALSVLLGRQQEEYLKRYGFTGTLPVSTGTEKKAASSS